MVFSSLTFISIFLPLVLLLYWIIPGIKAQNILLLAASLIFYAYGEPVYVFLMIGSAFCNYIWALLLARKSSARKLILVLFIIQNLAVLAVFKYAGFLVETANALFSLSLRVPQIPLPIGISFFTFQAMSYVIDVYRGQVGAQRNYFRLLLYISFFPQLIAGPIVKYHDIEQELKSRRKDADQLAFGLRRFVFGLGKKVLIANYVGAVADAMFAAAPDQLNILGAWLGAAAYMLQIHFDFSAYSDMAIGLGQCMGFHFKENFKDPYLAHSIKDFWNRWHISLSTWFKEYLYIPLGGNRRGRTRTVINKFIVFLATGIWHGANVTFLFWGIYHGTFLMLEEYIPWIGRRGGRVKNLASHIYTILVVLIGFVFFRAETMRQGLAWLAAMFGGFTFSPASMRLFASQLTPLNLTALAAGIILCLPAGRIRRSQGFMKASYGVSFLIFILSLLSLAGGSYNPFIYFRF